MSSKHLRFTEKVAIMQTLYARECDNTEAIPWLDLYVRLYLSDNTHLMRRFMRDMVKFSPEARNRLETSMTSHMVCCHTAPADAKLPMTYEVYLRVVTAFGRPIKEVVRILRDYDWDL